ncbi:hypothetical protein B0O99DRAFT_607358 [Bisporella sp. PMI_857]|nr:hypothetical protein B0O99DRAFT_607358 [Bisporella sp. PMI_857]
MPSITAEVSFLADIPLYEEEKPYLVLLSPENELDSSIPRSNLQYENHDVSIEDIRQNLGQYNIANCGFQVLQHQSKVSFSNALEENSLSTVDAYKRETEQLLAASLDATHVVCYDFKLRENRHIERTIIDLESPLLIEGPAIGAHNDVTARSGPEMIRRHLSPEDQRLYLKPGYRFRIVNTWRILNPVAEDSPLTLCDFRSIQPADLIEADRVIPGRAGEVYYIKYRASQRWCWLEHQTPQEPFMFVMYDTIPGDQARICPHIAFHNPRAPSNTPPRKSVETRSIVISPL